MYNKLFIPFSTRLEWYTFRLLWWYTFQLLFTNENKDFEEKMVTIQIAEANCLNSGDEQACARNASALKTQQEKSY